MNTFEELYQKTILETSQFSSGEVERILADAKSKYGNDLNKPEAQAWIKAQIISRQFNTRVGKLQTSYPKLFAVGSAIDPRKWRGRIDRAGNWLKTL